MLKAGGTECTGERQHQGEEEPWTPRQAGAQHAAPLQNRRLAVSLEGELERELDQSRVVHGGGHGAKKWGVEVGNGSPELGVIEEVEKFGAEVQIHILPGEFESLDDGEVRIHEIRT